MIIDDLILEIYDFTVESYIFYTIYVFSIP